MCAVLQNKVTLLYFIKLLKGMDMGFHAIPRQLRQCTYTNGAREIVAIFKPQKWKRVNGVIMEVQLWKFKFIRGSRHQTKMLHGSFKFRNKAAIQLYYPVSQRKEGYIIECQLQSLSIVPIFISS